VCPRLSHPHLLAPHQHRRRCVVAAYQVHAGAVNALVVGEGLAVTASDDRCEGMLQ
jgi:hypothetical protein